MSPSYGCNGDIDAVVKFSPGLTDSTSELLIVSRYEIPGTKFELILDCIAYG